MAEQNKSIHLPGKKNIYFFYRFLLLSIFFGVLIFNPCFAANYTWDVVSGDAAYTPGSGTWGVNSYWTTDGSNNYAWPGPGNSATFGGGDGTYTITINGTQYVDSLRTTSDGFTFTGGTLVVARIVNGTVFGFTPASSSSYDSSKAFDSDTTTYCNATAANGAYTGLDLGSGVTRSIGMIKFCPRVGYASYMTGGKFQGSNTSSSSGYSDLYAISSLPLEGYQIVYVTDRTPYRYLRYIGPDGSYCNVAEVQFYGIGNIAVTLQDTLRMDAVIGTPSGIYKNGPGIMFLYNTANTYTGPTEIVEGRINIKSVANGGENSSIGAASTDASNLVIEGTGIFRYVGSGSSTDRLLTFGAGTMLCIYSSGSGSLSFTNTGSVGYRGSGARYIYFGGTTSNTNTFNPSIGDGTGGLTYVSTNGSTAWILGGTNTYTGTTSVTVGELRINGSTSSSSAVTVSSAAILSGTGNAAGSVTINSGGIVNPGSAGAGKLRTGTFKLNSTSVFNCDIGTISDTIAVTGNLTLDGTINISAADGFTYGTYTIMTYSGTLTNNTMVMGTVPGGYTGTLSYGSGAVTLTNVKTQVITFGALSNAAYGSADYDPGATISSDLAITYTSSNTSVATIIDGKIHVVAPGTTTITASQDGDTYHSAATSVGQSLTVVKADQTITFGALAAKTYGDGTFSLTATASSGLTVTYASSNTAVATVSGSTVTIVGGGSTTITASQSGNTNYNAASNVQQALTVMVNQTITFGAPAAKTYGDAAFALGATASSGLTVTYASSNTSVATVSGSTVTIVGVGSTTITASQSGNSSYNAAADVPQTLTVNKAAQTITFGALAAKTYGDAAFALGATASSGLTVTYASSNTSVATVSGSTVTIVGGGSTIITASQSGNSNYNAASDVPQTLTVNKMAQTITFGALASKTYGNAPFTLGATSSSGLTVTYASSNTGVATVSGNTVTIVGAGSSTITASQSGNTNYNAASDVPQTLTVNKADQTITFGALSNKPYGSANYAPGAITTSGLTIAYSSSNTAVATIVSGEIHVVAPGTTTITASQSGNVNYNAASGVDQSLTVEKADQTITFGGLSNKPYGSANYAPGAITTSGLTIAYSSSNTAVATIVSGEIHVVAPGTTTIAASQAGNANYNAAVNVDQSLIVVKADQTITFGALGAKVYLDADYSPGATASSGLAVSYASGNAAVATIAGALIHIAGAGTSTITASQAGDANYNAASTVNQILTVGKADQTITFPAIPLKQSTDPDFDAGATASSGLTVTYASGTVSVATVSGSIIHLIGNEGYSIITASQAGNGNYNAAPDITRPCDVGKVSQTITFPDLPVTQYNDPDFSPGAAASSGLDVAYASSNGAVATIVSGKIHVVGLGTSTITASQAGDGSFFAAPDVVKTLTVGKDDQTITFGTLASKTYGDADFAVSAAASSGLDVSYSGSNTAIAAVSGNTVTITGAGIVTITASQAGDENYNAAADVQQTLTVNKADQAITFGALAAKIYGDADFAPGAAASSGLTVTYTSDNPAVAMIADGQIHITGAGSSTITASQSGNTNYNAAADVAQILTVNKLDQVITFGALAMKTYGDADFTLGATASSGLTVTYACSDTGVAKTIGNTVIITGAGTATLTASQTGNVNYNAATGVTQTLTVNKADQTITFDTLPVKTYGDRGFVPLVYSSSGLAVTLSSSDTTVASVSNDTLFIRGAGTATVTASQEGSTTYIAASSVQRLLAVNKKGILFIAENKTGIYMQQIPQLTWIVSGFVNGDDTSDIDTLPVMSTTAELDSQAGTYPIAIQGGKDNNYEFTYQNGVLTTGKQSQVITFDSINNHTILETSFNIRASSTSGLELMITGSDTSKVRISKDTVFIRDTGCVTVSANQSGNGNYGPAASIARTFCIESVPLDVPVLIVNDSERTDQSLIHKLLWHPVIQASSYHIQLSRDNQFASVINDSVRTDTSSSVENLDNNTIYFWRVRAVNRYAISAFSSPDSFTTMGVRLDAPVILTIIPSAMRVGTNIRLDWKAVKDAVSYGVEIATDSLFTNIIRDTVGTGMLSLAVNGLGNDSTYYWHVIARAGKNRSAWSTLEKFTTLAAEDSVTQTATVKIISDSVVIIPELKLISDSTNTIRNQIVTVISRTPENKTLVNVSQVFDLSQSSLTNTNKPISIVYTVPKMTINGVLMDSTAKKNIRAYIVDDSNRVYVIYNLKPDNTGLITLSTDSLRRILFAIDTTPPVIIDRTIDSTGTSGTILQITGTCYDNISNAEYLLCYRKGGNTQYDSIKILPDQNKNFKTFLAQNAGLDSCGMEYYLSASDGTNQVRLQRENISTVLIDRKPSYALPEMKWHLFASPVNPVDDSVSGMFSQAMGEYGKKWRMYRYENLPKDTLVEYSNGLSTFETGKCYWIKTRNQNCIVTIDTAITSPVNKCHAIEIPSRKWASISDPYMFSVGWKSILDSSGLSESEIIGPYAYSDSSWILPSGVDRIDSWAGYYVYNNSDKAVTLRIPSIKYQNVLVKKANTSQQVLEWVVIGENESSCNNQFGVSDAGTDEYDSLYDFPRPAAPDEGVSAYFYRDGFNAVARKFQADFTNLSGGGAVWHIKVENLKNGESYFCHVKNIELLPDSLSVYAIDLSSGTKWDMRKNAYGIAGSKDVSEVSVELVVGTASFISKMTGIYKLVPMQFGVSSLYPNPVRHMSRINYTIPYDPDKLRVPVNFSVYTMSGRRVFTINEQARSAGYYTILFDVTAGHNALSSGTYIYKLTAGRNWKSQVMKVVR